MKILLAEDDQNVATITQICLERLGGHQVIWVENGTKASQLGTSEVFDLIILDGMMPGQSGLEVAQNIRASGVQTPIVFLSAKSEASDYANFMKSGSGYIAKPFDPQTICKQIDVILENLKQNGTAA